MVAGGCLSYYNLQCIKLDKDKKSVLCIQKSFYAILKMGSIPCWVKFHAYPIKDRYEYIDSLH